MQLAVDALAPLPAQLKSMMKGGGPDKPAEEEGKEDAAHAEDDEEEVDLEEEEGFDEGAVLGELAEESGDGFWAGIMESVAVTLGEKVSRRGTEDTPSDWGCDYAM
ncbi:unnamed protein product [Chrysoparadoxa australica]